MPDVQEVVSSVGDALGTQGITPMALLRVVLTVLVGWLVIRLLMRMADRLLDRSKSLADIKVYIRSALRIFLWFLLALMLAGTLDVDVTGTSGKLRAGRQQSHGR